MTTDLPDYTPGGIARAILSECDRLGDPSTMMMSATSLRELAEAYLQLEAAARSVVGALSPTPDLDEQRLLDVLKKAAR